MIRIHYFSWYSITIYTYLYSVSTLKLYSGKDLASDLNVIVSRQRKRRKTFPCCLDNTIQNSSPASTGLSLVLSRSREKHFIKELSIQLFMFSG